MVTPMDLDRIKIAIGRIERATTRLEQLVSASADTPPQDDGLAAKHARLRAEVGATIAEIDNLLKRAANG